MSRVWIDGGEAYCRAAIHRECLVVEFAYTERLPVLNRAAFILGSLIAAWEGHPPNVWSEAAGALLAAAERNGSVAKYGEDKVLRTIKKGLDEGGLRPRKLGPRTYRS